MSGFRLLPILALYTLQCMLGLLQQVKLAGSINWSAFLGRASLPGDFQGYHELYSVYGNTVLKTHGCTTRVTEAE